MYVDVRRALVFFDRSDHALNGPPLTRYDPRTGLLCPVAGAQPDDVVCDVSRDGDLLAMRSADWLTVRGANRSRISFLTTGFPSCATDRVLSHWSMLSPNGRCALVGALNGKARPVVMDTASCDVVATIARDIDARFGEVDPIDGRLWAPDARARDSLLSVDCATGDIDRITAPVGANITRARFSRDGSSLFVVSQKGMLSRHGRDGSVIWSRDVSSIGRVGSGDLFLNEVGSHLLLSLPESKNSEWGEDLIFGVDRGSAEGGVVRHRAPPARLAADWFGDHLLTHAGEIVDFFSGEVVDKLSVGDEQASQPT